MQRCLMYSSGHTLFIGHSEFSRFERVTTIIYTTFVVNILAMGIWQLENI